MIEVTSSAGVAMNNKDKHHTVISNSAKKQQNTETKASCYQCYQDALPCHPNRLHTIKTVATAL